MPEMSGYEVAEKLRERYPYNTLPVIMLSAKTREDDIVKGLESGCNDFISKPFGCNELNARIDAQFKLRSVALLRLVTVLCLLTLPLPVMRKALLSSHLHHFSSR